MKRAKSSSNSRQTRIKLSICQECNEADSKDMVKCDNCNKWSHYRCVGVGDEIMYLDWNCKRCSSYITSITSVMFRSLQAADVKVDKMVKAIIASENQSLPNVSGQKVVSRELVLSTGDQIQKDSINKVPRVLAIDEIFQGSLESCSIVSQEEIPTGDRQEDFGDDLAVGYKKELPFKHQEDLASKLNLSDEGTVQCKIFSPSNTFKIDLREQFEDIEKDLLEEKNQEIIAKYYLSRICQNIEKEFIEQMVLMTCTKNFLKKISFSKDGRIYMKGTNTMKCWIETVTKKFYSSTVVNKDELKNQNNKIAKTIQETIRRIKNTASSK